MPFKTLPIIFPDVGPRRFGNPGKNSFPPTVAITSTEPSPTAASPIPVTITFSKQVIGFVVGDITITTGAGSLSGFDDTNNPVFTVNYTPASGGEEVALDIAAGVCTDLSLNENTAAAQFLISSNPMVGVTVDAYWNLTENSDGIAPVTRADASGNSGTLSDINTTPSAPGDNGIDCEVDNKEYLDRASTASLLVGDSDWTFVFLINAESGGVTQYVSGKGNATASNANFAWRLYMGADNKINFNVSDGTNSTTVTSTDALSLSTDYFVIVWHDSVNDQIGMKIDAGADKTAAHTIGALDNAAFPFKLGCPPAALGNVSANNTFDGIIRKAGKFPVVLNASQKVFLRNGGLGRAYPFFNDYPSVVISSSESFPSAAYPIPITITFSRPVTGFTIGDITCSAGLAVSNFTAVSASVYTVLCAPLDTSGTIEIAAGVCTGISDGAPNAAATQFSVSSSLTLPTAKTTAILALSPIAYMPMQELTGTAVMDVTGNDRYMTSNGMTLGQAGAFGVAYQFPGDADSATKLLSASNALSSAIDPNEVSVLFYTKFNSRVDCQVRFPNIYSGSFSQYVVLELRLGDKPAIFLKDSEANTQTANETVLGGAWTENTWIECVFFNSVSDGKAGIYVDKVLYEVSRTVGSNDTPADNGMPQFGAELDGYSQHLAFFDHKLSQAEVDAI